jgi:hypothetical protein
MSSPLPNLPIPAQTDLNSLRPVLDRIATTTVTYLQQGGYLPDAEAAPLLAAYGEKLGAASGLMPDFLNFTAQTQAQKHELTVEEEVARMQKLLRSSLNDRVHYWSFGPLSGKASALYDHCPRLRTVCTALGCPATLAGETSIVHVASLNPVAALVASFWISQELNSICEGESPFVFTFLTDLPVWQVLMQRHFAS